MGNNYFGWYLFDEMTLATVLAALRFYQNYLPESLEQDDWLRAIATNSGSCAAMTVEAVDELCDHLNTSPDARPEKAMLAVRRLVDVYAAAEADGGSVDWSDLDDVHALALEAIGAASSEAGAASSTIMQMVKLSPCHLSRCEYKGLSFVDGLTIHSIGLGYLLRVPNAFEIHLLPGQENGGPSGELKRLIGYAYERNVEWIMFDRDTKPISSLPVFDGWD